MKSLILSCFLIATTVVLVTAFPLPLPEAPPIPLWPNAYKAPFTMLAWLENGTSTNSPGVQYYDWAQRSERNDHLGTCFVFCRECDCSFYLIGNLYFVQNDTCCQLLDGIRASSPDWVKVCDYVGQETVNGAESTHWYGLDTHHYWGTLAPGNQSIPVRYSDNSYGTPLQITNFDRDNFQVVDSLPSSIFTPGPMDVCKQRCPPVPSFDALRAIARTRFARNRVQLTSFSD